MKIKSIDKFSVDTTFGTAEGTIEYNKTAAVIFVTAINGKNIAPIFLTYAFVKASKSKKREVVVQSISEGWIDRVIATLGYTTI